MANPIVHFEIGCRDQAATREFYSKLFDWNVKPDFNIETGGHGLDGHITALGHEPHNYTIFYVQVPKIADAIAKAESLGGKRVVGPIKIPTGMFAWVRDPEGNMVGLLEGQ